MCFTMCVMWFQNSCFTDRKRAPSPNDIVTRVEPNLIARLCAKIIVLESAFWQRFKKLFKREKFERISEKNTREIM